MKIDCIIGIDPGSSNGGIAVYVPGENVKTVKMPKDVADIATFLAYYKENYNPVVFLEKLNMRIDDVTVEDGKANMGKMFRMQKLMANYEHLKAVIEIAGVPYVMVHPYSWQSKLKLRVRGQQEDKAERKRRYAKVAGEWYPTIRITLWNADAVLIMHFGRWALMNDLKWVLSNLPQREHDKLF